MSKEEPNPADDVELAAFRALERIAVAVERIADTLDAATDQRTGAMLWTVLEDRS
jgi:hypothetical protein